MRKAFSSRCIAALVLIGCGESVKAQPQQEAQSCIQYNGAMPAVCAPIKRFSPYLYFPWLIPPTCQLGGCTPATMTSSAAIPGSGVAGDPYGFATESEALGGLIAKNPWIVECGDISYAGEGSRGVHPGGPKELFYWPMRPGMGHWFVEHEWKQWWGSAKDQIPIFCSVPVKPGLGVRRFRTAECPDGYLQNPNPIHRETNGDLRLAALLEPDICVKAPPINQKNLGSCPSPFTMGGNPIHLASGNKFQEEVDFADPLSTLSFKRAYNSLGFEDTGLGKGWRHNFQRSLHIAAVDTQNVAVARRPDGKVLTFRKQADGTLRPDADVSERLWRQADASGNTTWELRTVADELEIYDSGGRLQNIELLGGNTLTLEYASGKLTKVQDSFSRSLNFSYNAIGKLEGFSDPAGNQFSFAYDSDDHLVDVVYPDQSHKTYIYNEQQHTGFTDLPYALTGITDENGSRFATYKYDSVGRAVSTEHAGGAQRTTLTFNADGTTSITDALGTSRTMAFAHILGTYRETSSTHPCVACGGNVPKSTSYDSNGNVKTTTDFRFIATVYDYDLARNLETTRTEAYATGDQRITRTAWHPQFRLPEAITEPVSGGSRISTFVYDSVGNLERKTVTGPKNDGTSATVSRTWSWAYLSRGRVKAATDPNGKTTNTEYYPDSGPVGQRGNVRTVTNPNGHVTTYNAYDANGRPLTITDPNGLVTSLTYHPRGWIATRTVGGERTVYTYDGVGQLILVMMPDGSTLNYAYDAAHRLVQIRDGLGNRIAYTLDAMGNRVREETYDQNGVLARAKQRVFDSLNREHQTMGAKETSFEDVHVSNIARVAIERIYNAGITLGCATDPLRYCPNASVTRTQMAIFLLRAKYGSGYVPGTLPPPPGLVDVAGHPYKDWIAKVMIDGLMTSRDATHFEPDASMRRDEMSLSLVRLKLGSGYTAGPGSGVFADMSGNPYEGWAEAAKTQGITQGCDINPLRYCPSGSVTRASMALFFTRTISFPAVPNDHYCPSGTTYFGSNFGLSACTTGSCWAPTPFAGSTTVPGSTYPNTNYACATTPQMSGSIQSTLKSYDANGNPTTTKDPLGRTTTNFYDALNRPTSVRDPANGTTHYGYDAGGNLHNVKDPRNLTTSYTHDGLRNQIKQISPDTGTTARTFDAAGNVLTSIDARGVTTTWAYDDLGRILSATHTKPGTTPVTQTYLWDTGTNGKGRLAQLTEGGVTTRWTYTTQGRVATKQQVAGSLTHTVGYAYNAAGQLDTLTTPSGQQIKYAYLNGQVSGVKVNGQTLAGGIVRLPFGPVGGWQWGNGLHSFRYHDKDGRLTQWEHGNGSALLQNTLAWDLASRITAIADPLRPANNGSYEYDVLDRLKIARIAGSNVTAQEYGYDAIGNRLSRKVGIPATATTTYTYSTTSNRLASLTGFENRTYSYDGAGNPDAYGAPAFKHTYNNANRLVMVKNGTATVATYVVNALGQRISKTVGGTTTRFVYDEQGRLFGEYTGTGALVQETVWLDDLPLATLRPTGAGGTPTPITMYYVHSDHLGSPRAVTDPATNAVRWRWDNTDAFGVNAANENPGTGGVFKYGLRFPGQYYDAETGTHYNYYRDYDSSIGRYTQSDPIGLGGGINTYLYVGADPLLGTDPLGLARFCCRLLNSVLGESPIIGIGLGYRHCYVVADDGTAYGLYPETMRGRKTGVPRTNDPRDVGGECFDCPKPQCVDQDRCLRDAHQGYPRGSYSARSGPNSNTYAGTLARQCCNGGVPSGVRDAPGINASPPAPY